MAFRIVRKPFRIGSSLAITLPPAWCAYYHDRIATLTVLGNSVLVIAPEGCEAEALRLIKQEEQDAHK